MEPLERIIRDAYELGALGTTELGARLYLPRGWKQLGGEDLGADPEGIVRTPAEDRDILVLEGSIPLDLSGDLTCDWRAGEVW